MNSYDIQDLVLDEDWPEVVNATLEEMQQDGAPRELVQAAMAAVEPLTAWWAANEEVWEGKRAERYRAYVEKARAAEKEAWERQVAARVWAPSDPEGWAARHADEAAWAEHLRKLAEGSTDA